MNIPKRSYILAAGMVMACSGVVCANPLSGFEDEVHQETAKTKKTESNKPANNWLGIIGFILSLAALATAILGFLKARQAEGALAKIKDLRTSDNAKIKNKFTALEEEIMKQKRALDTLNVQLRPLQATATSNRSTAAPQPQAPRATQQPPQTQAPQQAPVVAPKPIPREIVKLYFGAPAGETFSNPSKTYVQGKSLYGIEDNGEKNCPFFFIENPDTATIAGRSVSRFIESGCIISGDAKDNFTKVKTLTPGMATKTPTGWKIVKKAVVELV